MAFNFSANQFESAYKANRLSNWEVPRWFAPHPRQRTGTTKIISNDAGHLLPNTKRSDAGPWSNFRSTYQLPDRITRRFIDDYNDCLQKRYKWKDYPTKKKGSCDGDTTFGIKGTTCFADCKACETVKPVLAADKGTHALIHPCEKEKKGKSIPVPPCPPSTKTTVKLSGRGKSPLGRSKPPSGRSKPQPGRSKPTTCRSNPPSARSKKSSIPPEHTKAQKFKQIAIAARLKAKNKLVYTPGDFTPSQQQHPTRQLLLDQKYERDSGIEPDLPIDKLNLSDHDCNLEKFDNPKPTFTDPLPTTAALTSSISVPIADLSDDLLDTNETDVKMPNMSQYRIAEKPNERCPSPVVPAYANFELARRMHHENLDHQPLPDCVADLAYRRLQLTDVEPGLALDIDPIATGIGIKTHNVGPTHCTKMKVYRPKTCGVGSKGYNTDIDAAYRPFSSTDPTKKPGAMDLAICWDYKPANPADEPQPPRHIDGTDETAGPAVFTCVKTPRDEPIMSAGRSAGVFTNTLGEEGFFEKDIMQRKTDFTGRNTTQDQNCGCGVDTSLCGNLPPPPRAHSVSRNYNGLTAMPSRAAMQYRSTPNMLSDDQIKSLRQKYLGADVGWPATGGPACKRDTNPGFLRRARNRLCHKVAPEPCHMPLFEPQLACGKAAFRAGLPKYNAAGQFVSADSGCSFGSNHSHRVLVVPRPRNPYAKKNYDIDTLVPPFRSLGGGSGEGGYPEHWRLASVYQHAYKPPELRRRSLLQTVYK